MPDFFGGFNTSSVSSGASRASLLNFDFEPDGTYIRQAEDAADEVTAALAQLESIEPVPEIAAIEEEQRWGDLGKGDKARHIFSALSTALLAYNNPEQTGDLLQSRLRARLAEREALRREKELAHRAAQAAKDDETEKAKMAFDAAFAKQSRAEDRAFKVDQFSEDTKRRAAEQAQRFADDLSIADKQDELANLRLDKQLKHDAGMQDDRQRHETTVREAELVRDLERHYGGLAMNVTNDIGLSSLIATKLARGVPLTEPELTVMEQGQNRLRERQITEQQKAEAELELTRASTLHTRANTPTGEFNLAAGQREIQGTPKPDVPGVSPARQGMEQTVIGGRELTRGKTAPAQLRTSATGFGATEGQVDERAAQIEAAAEEEQERVFAQVKNYVSKIRERDHDLDGQKIVDTVMHHTGAQYSEAVAALVVQLPPEIQMELQQRSDLDPVQVWTLYQQEPEYAMRLILGE